MTGWTRAIVIERLEEAAETLKLIPNTELIKRSRVASAWPEVVHAAREAYQIDEFNTVEPRIGMAAGAYDRMEEVFWWMQWVDRETQKLIWLRSEGIRWWKLELRRWRFPRSRKKGRVRKLALQQHYTRGIRYILAKLKDRDGE